MTEYCKQCGQRIDGVLHNCQTIMTATRLANLNATEVHEIAKDIAARCLFGEIFFEKAIDRLIEAAQQDPPQSRCNRSAAD